MSKGDMNFYGVNPFENPLCVNNTLHPDQSSCANITIDKSPPKEESKALVALPPIPENKYVNVYPDHIAIKDFPVLRVPYY